MRFLMNPAKFKRKSVLVLDSGIGGMTVVKAIRELASDIAVTYISDNAFFPYGRLNEDELIRRIHKLMERALGEADFDAVVIACNTASTVVLNQMRNSFQIPIIGVVPPIKTASEISKTRIIGLLATEGTVRCRYVDELIQKFASDCHVERVQCPDLAPLAEAKFQGRKIDKSRLRACIAPLMEPELAAIDVVILGCTHYPLLLEDLRREFPQTVRWLDPALPVARRLLRVLGGCDISTHQSSDKLSEDIVYFTAKDSRFPSLKPKLIEIGFSRTECLTY
jgi:glutamate racemase